VVFLTSCDLFGDTEKGKITGTQSEIGAKGSTFTMSAVGVTGVSNLQASVTDLSGGISTINGSATVTNTTILNLIKAYPGDLTLNGNAVTLQGMKVKFLSDGFEKTSGVSQGVICNYESSVGDTYPIVDSNKERKVTAKTTTDSYDWGGMKIKTMEVTEPVNNYGIKNIEYITNHKWGVVAVIVTFDDNTTLKIPIASSKSN
jgi:hypothetical protein